MNSKLAIEGLEQNIQQSQEFVELGKALERLSNNKDFLAVVKRGYFEKEAIRLVHLKADPSMQTPERQQSVVSQIDSIGNFSAYLQTLKFNADRAEHSIETDRMTIEELSAEDL
jgi:hypothetical protein